MPDTVAPDEIGKVAGRGVWVTSKGMTCVSIACSWPHDRAVLDALEDAAPLVGVVRIERLDLDDDGRGGAE